MQETNLSLSKKNKILLTIIGCAIIVLVILLLLVKGCGREFTIEFDTNGGSKIESVTVKGNETVEEPEDPTREGYEFAGWYLGDEKYDFDNKVTEDLTLEAHWHQSDEPTPEEKDLELKLESLSLGVNDTSLIEVSVFPNGYTLENLKFTSSDENIASVDANGLVTAKKAGKVTITISTADGKYSKTVTVEVIEAEEQPNEPVAVQSVKVIGGGYFKCRTNSYIISSNNSK